MFEADRFVADCRAALAEVDGVSAVREVVDRVAADPGAVGAALGEPSHGGIDCLQCGRRA